MRVTVGIPFYNAEATLPDAVRSVFAQTFDDWELLLVDDGSTDGSLLIAKSAAGARVRVIHDGVNRGLQFRLNQIASEARGEYLARMDSDDMMHPERLARQLEYLDVHPATDVIDTGAYTMDGSGNILGVRGISPPDTTPDRVLKHGLMFHPTVMGRAEWFRGNPYDERYTRAEDYELWCRTCAETRFGRVMAPLYYYREDHRDPRSYLRAYLKGMKSVGMIYRRYGPPIIGWPGTVGLIAGVWGKSAAYRAATMLGLQSRLVARRSMPMSDAEREAAMAAKIAVFKTVVPGMAAASDVFQEVITRG